MRTKELIAKISKSGTLNFEVLVVCMEGKRKWNQEIAARTADSSLP